MKRKLSAIDIIAKEAYPPKKKGFIIDVQDMGTMWSIIIAKKFVKGKPIDITRITGDWRPMRDGLDSAFDISSKEFPYVSKEKIDENVIGQQIEYEPDPIFGASGWQPTSNRLSEKEIQKWKARKLAEVL